MFRKGKATSSTGDSPTDSSNTSPKSSTLKVDPTNVSRSNTWSKFRTRSPSIGSKMSANDDASINEESAYPSPISPESPLPDLLSQTPETVKMMPVINPRHLNSLQLAVFKGEIPKMLKLMSEPDRDLNKLDRKHGFTAVHLAILQNKMDVFKELVGHSPQVVTKPSDLPELPTVRRCGLNTQDNHGRSPLVLATIFGRNDMVAHLMFLGADPNSLDEVGCTALHYSLLTDNKSVFDLVLAKNPALGIYDRTQNTLLHHAIRLRRVDMAKALVAKGANISRPNGHKKTPLHVAVEKNVEEMARFLVESGAPLDQIDESNLRPIDYAKHNPALKDFLILKAVKVASPPPPPSSEPPPPPAMSRKMSKDALLVKQEVPPKPSQAGTNTVMAPIVDVPVSPTTETPAVEKNAARPIKEAKKSASRERLAAADSGSSSKGLANKAIRDLKKNVEGGVAASVSSIGGSIQFDELDLAESPPEMSEVSDPTPPSSGGSAANESESKEKTNQNDSDSSDSELWNTMDLTEDEKSALREKRAMLQQQQSTSQSQIPQVVTDFTARGLDVVSEAIEDESHMRDTESEISDIGAPGMTEPVEMVSVEPSLAPVVEEKVVVGPEQNRSVVASDQPASSTNAAATATKMPHSVSTNLSSVSDSSDSSGPMIKRTPRNVLVADDDDMGFDGRSVDIAMESETIGTRGLTWTKNHTVPEEIKTVEEIAEAQNSVAPMPLPAALSTTINSGRSSRESSSNPSSSASRKRAVTIGGSKPDTKEILPQKDEAKKPSSVSRSSSTKSITKRLGLGRRSRQPSVEVSMPEAIPLAPFDPNAPRPERMGLGRMLAEIQVLQSSLTADSPNVAATIDELKHIVDEARAVVAEMNFERGVMLQQYRFVNKELDLNDGQMIKPTESSHVDFSLISAWVGQYKKNSGPELDRRARAIEQKEREIGSLASKLEQEAAMAAQFKKAHLKQIEQIDALHAQQVESLENDLTASRKKHAATRNELEEARVNAQKAQDLHHQQISDLNRQITSLETEKKQQLAAHQDAMQQQKSIQARIESERETLKQRYAQLNADMAAQHKRLEEDKARALDSADKAASIKLAEKQANIESLKKTTAKLEERVRERAGTADETYKKLDEARAEADKYKFEAECLTKRIDLDTVRSSNLKREVALMRRMMGLPERPESLPTEVGVPVDENPDKEYFTRLESECARLQTVVNDLEMSRKALEAARETERFRVEELADEVKNMSKALRSEKAEHASARDTVSVLTLDLEKSKSAANDLESRLQQLERERPKWTSDIAIAETQFREKYESQVYELQKELDTCKEHLAAEKVALELRDRQLASIRQQMRDSASSNPATVSAEFTQPIEVGQDMVRYFESEIKLLSQNLEHERTLRLTSDAERQRVLESLSELESNLTDVRQLYEAELTANQTHTANLLRYSRDLESTKAELSAAMDKIHEQELKAVRLQSDVQGCSLQQQQQAEIIAKLDAESSTARAEAKSLQRHLEDKQRRVSELESQLALLDIRLVDQTTLVHSLERDVTAARNELAANREEIITAQGNVTSLTHRLRSAERALQEQEEAGIRADEDGKDSRQRLEREIRELHRRAQEERDAAESESRMAHERYKTLRAELEQQRATTTTVEATLRENELALHKARVEILELDEAKADLETKFADTHTLLQAELDRVRVNNTSIGTVLMKLKNMESKSPSLERRVLNSLPEESSTQVFSLGVRSRSNSVRVRTWSETKQDANNIIGKLGMLTEKLTGLENCILNDASNWMGFINDIENDLNLDGAVKATVQTLANAQQVQFVELQDSIGQLKEEILSITESTSTEINSLQTSVKTLTAHSEQRERELNAEIDAIRAEWKSDVTTIQTECKSRIATIEAKMANELAALETLRSQQQHGLEGTITEKLNVISELTEAKNQLQAQVVTLESELRQLSVNLSQEQSKVAAADLARTVLERRIPGLEHQIRYLEQELQIHEPKFAESESSRLALVSRAFELEKEIQNKATLLEEKEHIIASLNNTSRLTEKRVAELLNDLSNRETDLKLANNNLHATRQALLGDLSVLREQNAVLQNNLDVSAARATDLSSQLGAARRYLDQIQASYDAATSESQQLQVQIRHFKSAAESDKKAAEEYLKLKVAQLEEQARIAKKHDEDILATTQKQLEVAEADAQKLWKAKAELEEERHVLSEERSSLEADLRSRTTEHEIDRKSLEDKRRSLEESLQRAEAQIEQLTARVENLTGLNKADEVDKRSLQFDKQTNQERVRATEEQLKLVQSQVKQLFSQSEQEKEGRMSAELECNRLASDKKMLEDATAVLKERVSSLEASLHKQVAEANTLLNRAQLLDEDREKAELEKQRLLSSMQATHDARVALENEVRQYQVNLDSTTAKLRALSTEHAHHERDTHLQITKLESEKKILQESVGTLKERVTSLDGSLRKQVVETDSTLKKVQLLEEEHEKAELEKQRLLSSMKTMQDAKLALENQVRQYQVNLDTTTAKLSNISTEHTHLESDSQLQTAKLESEKKILQEAVDKLKQRVASLESSLHQQVAETDSVLKKVQLLDEDREKAELEKQRLLSSVKTLQDAKSALESQIQRYQANLDTTTAKLTTISTEHTHLESDAHLQIATLESDKRILQETVDKLRDRVASLEASLHKQVGEADKILKKVQLLEEDREIADLEKARLLASMQTTHDAKVALENEVRQYQVNLDTTTAKLTSISTEYAHAQSDSQLQKAKLDSEKKILQDAVDKLKERVSSLEGSLHHQVAETDTILKRFNVLQEDNEKTELHRQRLIASLKTATDAKVALEAELGQYRNKLDATAIQLSSVSSQSARMENDGDLRTRKLESDKKILQETVDNLKERIGSLEATLHTQVVEADTVLKKVQLLEEDREKAELEKHRLLSSVQAAHDAKVAIEIEVRQYQVSLDTTTTKLSILSQQYAQLENESKNLKFELTGLEETKQQLSQRLHQRQLQLETTLQENERLKHSAADLELQKSELEFDRKALGEKKHFLEEQLKSRQQQLGTITNEVDVLAESQALWEVEKSHLEFERRQLEERLHLFSEQLKTTQSRLTVANMELESLSESKIRLESEKDLIEARALAAESQSRIEHGRLIAATAEGEALMVSRAQAEADAERLEHNRRVLEEQLKERREELSFAQAEIESLMKLKGAWEIDRKQLVDEVASRDDRLEKREATIKRLKREYESSQESLAVAEAIRKRLDTDLNKTESQLKHASFELERLKSAQMTWESERLQISERLDKKSLALVDCQRELETAVRLHREAITKVATLSHERIEMETDIRNLSRVGAQAEAEAKVVAELKSELEVVRAKLDEAMRNKRDAEQHYMLEKHRLESELGLEIESRRDGEQRADRTRRTLEEESSLLSKARATLEERVAFLENQKRIAEAKVQDLMDALTVDKMARAQLREAREARDAAEATLRTLEVSNGRLKRDFDTLKADAFTLSTEAAQAKELSNQVQALNAELGKSNNQLANLESRMRLTFDEKLRKIVTRMEVQSRERERVEMLRDQNVAELKEAYMNRIDDLSHELEDARHRLDAMALTKSMDLGYLDPHHIPIPSAADGVSSRLKDAQKHRRILEAKVMALETQMGLNPRAPVAGKKPRSISVHHSTGSASLKRAIHH
ncbi:hypothetical protein SmJEL517_g01877 [Synchytrium microbalum]|uniref:Uncharacterized protein n=1 Tax=Synchytrium microbalum TaxID=1806994 RepID=A0A507C8D2_9FUNG|nr:uncharacterized protein SmJEL517_g01877 [Synchytrium microbalum]TPX35771.1 hypothetical protein SmJEL517_g01877 [Synchytrium microbalum]